MANKNSYEIVIKNQTTDNNDSPISGSSNKPNTTKEEKGNASAKNIVKGLVAYNSYVKPFVSSVIGHAINTVSLRTGAQEYQQKLQFAYDTIGQVANIGVSILTGFAIGNVAGAVVGALIGVSTTLMNYANKADTINLERNLENITLQGLNVRAGGFAPSYSGSRGGRQ